MNDTNLILLSIDPDAAITTVSFPMSVSIDSFPSQAQSCLKVMLGTEAGGSVFFVSSMAVFTSGSDVLDPSVVVDPSVVLNFRHVLSIPQVLNDPIAVDNEPTMAAQLGHFSYEWTRWNKGKLREALKTHPNPQVIQVVAIMAREFRMLPPREFLLELPGGKFVHKRPSKAPSNGARPKEFSESQADQETRIHIDRLREPDNTSVPVALLVPSFGTFQTNVRNIASSDRAMRIATKMANELCVIFRDEQERAQKFCSILSEFLSEDVVLNATIGDFKTDGGVTVDKDGPARLLVIVKLEQTGTSDPCFQVSLSYLENTRRVRQDVVDDRNAKAAAAWVRARLPSILISHPGLNIQILGGVMTDRPKIEVLTPSVPMYYHVSNQDLFLDLARTLTALNILFGDLGKLYDNPPPLNPLLHVYPYPRGFKLRDEVVSFTYLQRVDPIRLVFEAHKFGIAPELVAYDDTLPGGWKMVVIKPIPKGYVEIDSIKRGREEQGKVRALAIAQMQHYLDERYVHGDLRAANIFVDGERLNIMVIDYDWAGRNKEVMYPPDVRSSMEIWHPRGDLSLCVIEREHDWQMLEHLYY
ncbi:hypothetical protein F5876DRAFT_79125 [Lentinula aff. lateritia]|uniref:Uncharacterized protein n=1 Tax=Lentinula aff. lateritia TaxID=2804960 RepID=A0ACC1TTJ9_9AGAR|nr:hypothetical protein F5876DRAFT_79125 [Lentinula aff. lateritia]